MHLGHGDVGEEIVFVTQIRTQRLGTTVRVGVDDIPICQCGKARRETKAAPRN